MNWLTFLPSIVSAVSTIKSIIDVANSNLDVVTKIKTAVPGLVSLLESYAAQAFPQVAPELHVAAAVMTAFDPNVTKWVQGSLNVLLSPSPALTVDGIYGPKTTAAVQALQAKLGLKVDGWAGVLTQNAISAALASNPTIH